MTAPWSDPRRPPGPPTGSEKEAAHRLGLSHSTVKHHLANARSKVGATTTAQLVWILAPRLPGADGLAETEDGEVPVLDLPERAHDRDALDRAARERVWPFAGVVLRHGISDIAADGQTFTGEHVG